MPDGIFASGQYFDLPSRTQRGLHGTSAALRVLAEESSRNENARTVACGIVDYLKRRTEIESNIVGTVVHQRELLRDKLRHDNTSTIKQAELLYALGWVSHGVVGADDLRTSIIERLAAGRADDGAGWPLVLDPAQRTHALATAHVIRALMRNGHPCEPWITYLREGLISRSSTARVDALAACVDCFVLQVLLEGGISDREARTVFDSLWRALAPSLAAPREANVDFFDGDRQNFVRVAWQVHLAVAAALVRPYRRYLGTDIQRVLTAACIGVTSGAGFRYPESGEHVSTRLYGYLYDSLSLIVGRRFALVRSDVLMSHLLDWANVPANALRHAIRVLLLLASVVVIGIGTWSWLRDEEASISVLAPNFLSGAVLGVLGWYFGRVRR